MQTSIGHVPNGQWQFDDAVTDCFEDMLQRSIPQYEVMRKAVTDLAAAYAVPGSYIVDLGCSRGEAIARLIAKIGAGFHYVGVEASPSMAKAAQERFTPYNQGIVRIESIDLRHSYPAVKNASVVLSVLTLQFVPIEYRQTLMESIYSSMKPGGALLLVEKVLGNTAPIDRAMVERYLTLKGANGYSQTEIDRKRYSLEGVLVPVTARWNEDLLGSAGFRHVDCFWRWMNFAGWIAVK